MAWTFQNRNIDPGSVLLHNKMSSGENVFILESRALRHAADDKT